MSEFWPEVETWVYVIGPTDDLAEVVHMKIGIASNVETRLRSLQTCHHTKLKIHYRRRFSNKGLARLVERLAHYLLARSHARGEWYRAAPLEAARAVREAVILVRRTRERFGYDIVVIRDRKFWDAAIEADISAGFKHGKG